LLAAFVYHIAIRVYGLAIAVYALFNTKAAKWVEGRKQFPEFRQLKGFKVWFHCASLGEFEQARPLLEKIKQQYPHCSIVLSFFSPSGYEVRKNYEQADMVVYLPLDTPANAQKFIDSLNPNLVLFVKYEFWYNYLNELQKRGIPTILFSAIFRPKQHFFKWYGGFFKNMLHKFSHVFVQDAESEQLLKGIGIAPTIANDTRFDRVQAIAGQRKTYRLIDKFKSVVKVFVAGSTWPADEEIVMHCINSHAGNPYKYIIAPHELDIARMKKLAGRTQRSVLLLSELTEENAAKTDIVVIDNFGMLASLYAYADVAYIGGGFNTSVHNVLEAAVYGVPVVFGPNHQKSAEAKELVKLKGAFVVNTGNELGNLLIELEKGDNLKTAGKIAGEYVQSKLGGTAAIYSYLNQKQLLPQ
jgi:3-deoxy-D-manno-octulosonic-acid transferase